MRPGGDAAAELIVVEGYMDVIALHQAGFGGAVAPLGTALTVEQMEALWRAAAAPVLCFDGDAAGRRAAIKAAETALPLLTSERSLRFCRLPEGDDPDSVLRRQGAGAMRAILAGARPMGDVLFDLLGEGVKPDAAPEQRSALYGRLVAAAGRIADRTLAREYRDTLTSRFFATFRARQFPPQIPARTECAGRGSLRSAPQSAPQGATGAAIRPARAHADPDCDPAAPSGVAARRRGGVLRPRHA